MSANAAPNLYLILDAIPGDAAQERLKAVLSAVPVASALVRAPDGRALDAGTARPFVEVLQAANVAALIQNDPAVARALRADGVHLAGRDAGPDAGPETLDQRLQQAREILGQRYIVGVEVLTKHDAMTCGEGGADYIAFSGPEALEFVSWWSEIFEVPCVAFAATSADEARAFAAVQADFVAFEMPAGGTVADAAGLARAVAAAASDAVS